MSITFLSHPIHLPDFFKFDREYLGKQESQNEDQKVFHKDILEVSQLSKNRENLMDKIKHTVVHSVTSFSDMRAGILKEIREEKGQYDYTDVVNACGLSYARLYSEIEQRYENEQYYKVDGTPLTKEDEIEWLDIQFEQEAAWQKSCARIAAQGQVIQGKIFEMPTKEMTEEGVDFDEVLKDAQDKGYAEKDPTADIEGHDPCRKIAILTSLVAGQQVDFEDIHCEGITKITPEDIKYAKAMHRAIKLLASSRKVGDSYTCLVAPYMIDDTHPLSGVNGVFNGVFLRGNVLGDAMFYGSGAGKLPTASAVVADVVDMTKHQNTNIYIDWKPEKLTLVSYDDSVNSFFVRTDSPKSEVEAVFGHVDYIEDVVDGEYAFTTGDMTEKDFADKASKVDVINRIRL